MSHYKPYSAYKDSGVEWIGQVPEHWEIKRLKFTVAASKNGVWGEDPAGNLIDDMPCVRVADFDRENLRAILDRPTMRKVSESERKGRVLAFGDLLLEKSGGGENQPVGCVVRYEDTVPAVCSNFVARLVVSDNCDSEFVKFLNFALYSTRISTNSINQTSGIQNLDQDRYFNEIVTLPDKEEQAFIALKIRAETTRIDTLIAKKTRFIELLKEKRQALITHAVTKGLDPNVKMKDSGVEWIGEVPEHWEVMPVKFKFDARLGKMIQPVSSSDSDVLIPYHRAQTVQWESIDDAAVEKMWASPSDIKKFSIKTGDLLICEGGDVCRSAIVKNSPWNALIYQNSIHRVRAKDQYSVDWILRLMQHLRSSGWIDVLCNKNTIVHFTSEKLGALMCAFPTPKEASDIIDNLDRETTRIDTLIEKSKRSIDLLKERRSALITTAVTGQIDLREPA